MVWHISLVHRTRKEIKGGEKKIEAKRKQGRELEPGEVIKGNAEDLLSNVTGCQNAGWDTLRPWTFRA